MNPAPCIMASKPRSEPSNVKGWTSFLKNDRSFTRTNGTIKNDHIVPKKRTEPKERVFKNIGTERNRTDISLKERLKSGTRSYYHFKSGMFIVNHK